MINVVIVEDNLQLEGLLKQALESHPNYHWVASFHNAEDAIEQIPDLLPDVVLMDIGLPGKSGSEAVGILKPICPNVEFMMCTIYDEDEKVFEALGAGANGYIIKGTDHHDLLDAIRELHEGGSPMSSDIARKVVRKMHFGQKANLKELYKITKREEEILTHLAKGLMYKEIADALFISEKTMRKHIYNIYEKMHVHSKVEAINKYFGR